MKATTKEPARIAQMRAELADKRSRLAALPDAIATATAELDAANATLAEVDGRPHAYLAPTGRSEERLKALGAQQTADDLVRKLSDERATTQRAVRALERTVLAPDDLADAKAKIATARTEKAAAAARRTAAESMAQELEDSSPERLAAIDRARTAFTDATLEARIAGRALPTDDPVVPLERDHQAAVAAAARLRERAATEEAREAEQDAIIREQGQRLASARLALCETEWLVATDAVAALAARLIAARQLAGGYAPATASVEVSRPDLDAAIGELLAEQA